MDLFNKKGKGIAGLNTKSKIITILPAIIILLGSNFLNAKYFGGTAVIYILIADFVIRRKDKNQ